MDLHIFMEIRKRQISEEEKEPTMFNQLRSKVMEYWSEDSKNIKVTNKIFKNLKIYAKLTKV